MVSDPSTVTKYSHGITFQSGAKTRRSLDDCDKASVSVRPHPVTQMAEALYYYEHVGPELGYLSIRRSEWVSKLYVGTADKGDEALNN